MSKRSVLVLVVVLGFGGSAVSGQNEPRRSGEICSLPPDGGPCDGVCPRYFFNADTGQYTDLVKDGVIDPTKVVRTALENGSSVARILLSTDVCISDKPDDDGDGDSPDMGEDMDY